MTFPEKVANKLRRALYYTNQDPDPKQALRYYKEALALCEEEGLDPFSDEVIGVKIQIAAFLEGIWNHATAAKILEQLLADCKKWVELEGNKHIQDGRRSAVLRAAHRTHNNKIRQGTVLRTHSGSTSISIRQHSQVGITRRPSPASHP